MADCSQLSKYLLELTEAIAEMPNVHNIDNVVEVMRRSVPLMNRETLVDAIVEATTGKKRKVDELKQKIAEIKREAKSDKGMQKTIKLLENYIETGTHPESTKESTPKSQAIKELKIIVKKLRAELSKTEAAKKHRQKKAEPKRINSLKQEIARLEKHIMAGTLPEKVGRARIEPTDMVRILTDKRAQLKKELAKTEPARIYRLKEQISLLEEKLKTGDIFPKPKEDVPSTRAIDLLNYQKKRLQQDIRARIAMSKPKNVWGHTKEVFNAFRALMTGGEFSLVLRQGGWTAMSRPGIAAKALPKMFKSFASEKVSHQINEEIFTRSNAHLYAKGGLHLAPIDGSVKLSAMEELYMSHYIEKIPGIKNFQRAGLTFLNEIRADSFDTLNASLPLTAAGVQNQVELEAIANYVNIATGRGNLGKMEGAAEGLNTVFFAPKYVASRFQLLVGEPLHLLRRGKATAVTRKIIAKEYARALTGITAVLALGVLAGGEVEDDPRSTDFLKIKFGKTRLDPMMGLAQTITPLARVISGEVKRGSGKVVPIRPKKYLVFGEKRKMPYKPDTAWTIMTRFMRSKLSPMAGAEADLLVGQTMVGEELDAKYPLRYITPLAYKDIYEALQDQGIAKGTAMSMLVFFGMGLQTYEQKGKKQPELMTR